MEAHMHLPRHRDRLSPISDSPDIDGNSGETSNFSGDYDDDGSGSENDEEKNGGNARSADCRVGGSTAHLCPYPDCMKKFKARPGLLRHYQTRKLTPVLEKGGLLISHYCYQSLRGSE